MTDKRIKELMKAKGFYPFEGRLDVFYEYDVTVDRECVLQDVSLIRCSNGRYRVDYKRRDSGGKVATDARFHNSIAAATYANRVVIPTLLAAKEK